MAGLRARLPRGRHQHDVPDRPGGADPRQRARRRGRRARRGARGRASASCSRPRPRRSARPRAPSAARRRRTAAATCRSTSAPSTRARSRRSRPRGSPGSTLVAVNPSSVQGPGRAGGTGRILIAYLNGRLRGVRRHARSALVDIDDCVEAHVLAAERGAAGRALRDHGRDDHRARGARASSPESPACAATSGSCPPAVARWPATVVEGAFRVRGRKPPFCREMVRTLLHGHRYDGSRPRGSSGLEYTPVADTFRRTIEWARRGGPRAPPDGRRRAG